MNKAELSLFWRILVVLFWAFLLVVNSIYTFTGSIQILSFIGAVCAGFLLVANIKVLHREINNVR